MLKRLPLVLLKLLVVFPTLPVIADDQTSCLFQLDDQHVGTVLMNRDGVPFLKEDITSA